MSASIGDIRALLLPEGSQLTPAEIVEGLGLANAAKDVKNYVYGCIRRGVMSGMFVRHHSQSGLSYTLNRDYSPGKPGPKKNRSSRAEVAAERGRASATNSSSLAVKAEASRAHQADVDSQCHRTELGKLNPDSCRTMIEPQRANDFDLRRRLDAIGTDIADAIADACDAEHPYALIKALVVSREAVSRAQAALPR